MCCMTSSRILVAHSVSLEGIIPMYFDCSFLSCETASSPTLTLHMYLVKHLQRLAAQQPDKILYEWFERTPNGDIIIKRSFSYHQVWNHASNLAHHLAHEDGVKPGDRVLLCYPPCVDFLLAFLGCILANVIPVPAYPPNPQSLKATIPAFEKIKHLANAHIVLTNKQYHRWTSLNIFATWPPGLR